MVKSKVSTGTSTQGLWLTVLVLLHVILNYRNLIYWLTLSHLFIRWHTPPPSLYKFVLQFTSGIVRRKEMLRNMFRGSVFGICMFGVRCSKSQVSTGNILLCIKYYRFMLIVVWNYFYLLKKFSLNASWNTIMIKILRVLIWHLSGKLWNILIK